MSRRSNSGEQPRTHPGNESWLDKDLAQKLRRLSFISKKALVGGLVGDHRSARKGFSLEFSDYRKYVPGDDLRRIDWNIYARLEKLFVKVTEAQEPLTLHVLLDSSLSMDWGHPNKLHYAKRAAAALAYVALSQSDWVTAASLSDGIYDRFPPVRGRGQVGPFFEFLDRVRPSGETNLREALRTYQIRSQARSLRGVVVLISDLLNPIGLSEGLSYLTSDRTEVVVVHLLDPTEAEPQLQGDLRLEDVETDERVEITFTPMVLERYRERFQAWCEEMQTTCQRRGAHYVRLFTNWPLENLVLSYLRQRRLLR